MNQTDLFGVDEALAVKAHGLVLQNLSLEAFLVVQIGEHGVEALDPGGSGSQQHLAAGCQHVHAVGLEGGLHTFPEVAAGNGNAEHPVGSGADFIGVQDPLGTFQGSHQQGPAYFHAKLLFRSLHGRFHGMHILCALTLGDPNTVGTAGNADPNILLPVGGIQTVDPDNDFGAAVVNGGQGMVQAESCGILLILGHSVFQVQHNGVTAIDVGILDESGLLGVHEHHGSAQAEPFRLGSSDHLTAPPQGMLALEASQDRYTAHSTRALMVQSRAPLSTTVIRTLLT